MKTFILVYTLAAFMLTSAVFTQTGKAQTEQVAVPEIIKLHNAAGEHIGTVTVAGNSIYIHNRNDEHIATIVQNPDGSKTMFDSNGNVIGLPISQRSK